jgi:hypothetical protein
LELDRNKRIYERSVFEKVLADPDIREKLEKRTLFAHAEHPEGMQSSTEKIAGIVKEIQIGDKNVYAVMEVLDTPYGRICDTLLRAGCGLGTSTRAEGELEEAIEEGTGNKYFRVVPEAYKFVTVDWTADPSTYGSFPESVEMDLTKTIKNGLEAKKIDAQYAATLLETMKCKEAVSLRESLKEAAECPECGKAAKHEDNCPVLKKIIASLPKEERNESVATATIVTNETTTSASAPTVTVKIDEQGGSHSTGLGEIWKAFEVAMKEETTKKISESKTIKEKSDIVVNEFKALRERVAVLEAENTKLAEISEGDISKVRTNYIRDVKDYNKKIAILQEELNAHLSASESEINEIKERFEADKAKLGVEVRKEFESKISEIEKTTLESTQKVYESKFKELKETFTREVRELGENYNSKLMKMLVAIKVREAGLQSELTPRHLTLLESCKSEEQIIAKLDAIRIQVKEGSFHSDDFKTMDSPIVVSVKETKTKETSDLESSLGETLHLLKSMK